MARFSIYRTSGRLRGDAEVPSSTLGNVADVLIVARHMAENLIG